MDLYTTSFTFPHRPVHSLRTTSPSSATINLPGSTGPSVIPLPSLITTSAPLSKAPSATTQGVPTYLDKEWEAVQALALEITTREGCLVTVTKGQSGHEAGAAVHPVGKGHDLPVTGAPAWNFHLSGSYQSVMAARGAILRECPRDNRFALKVPRTDILEKPLARNSALKPDVKRRLDDIAAESQADISVVSVGGAGGGGGGSAGQILAVLNGSALSSKASNGVNGHSKTASGGSAASVNSRSSNTPARAAPAVEAGSTVGEQGDGSNGTSSAPITYGLETERMCEIVITGGMENVEVAKVRLLVMLDELSGLHAQVCEIDYKLHAIIAGRKRSVIQSIQEETATNIYYPVPLVGVLDRPPPGSSQGQGYRSMNMNMNMNPNMGMNGSAGPMSMQNTGMTGMAPQMTGHSFATSMGMSNGSNWNMGPQMTGSMSMRQGNGHGYGHGHGQMNGYGPHGSQHSGPIYNPHQLVQYPYQPQPLDFDSQRNRGMPYAGPSTQHYGQHYVHGYSGHGQAHGMPRQMPPQHTGMSHMTSYPSQRALRSPGHMNANGVQPSPSSQHGYHQPFPLGPLYHGNHPHSPNISHPHSPVDNHAYGNGQHHMHVGLGNANDGLNGSVGQTSIHGQATGMSMGPGGHFGMPGHYGHGPHPGLSVHGGEQGSLGKANQVWITGEFFGVQRARDMLLNVAMQKSKLVISRDTAILPRKLDWLLLERLDDVKAIMSDNGTYMQVPSVGSQASLITVFGDHRVNIERSIRSIMSLACQFYVASFWLLPVTFDVLMPQASLNPAQMQPVLRGIAQSTGAEVVFKSNCFEMHGLETEVRAAVSAILELDIIRGFHHEIRFQIELANEHRDFISGKKHGKINKIMKQAGVRIKFETLNDYNFLIDIAGSDTGALQGLSLLQEELPAETSFHVPEIYHKRIIGVAGKNIQRIMKTYGVYVKFSNAEEFTALGGYAENDDNVIGRTPAKNAVALENLRQGVMEMVNPKDKDYTTEAVSIPRRYHRTLLGEKSIFIHDIESKTNSSVRFPYKESASDIVSIFGPESQVHIAAAMLLDHVPFEADLHVPPNSELTTLVSSPDFILFTERIKRDHQIAIAPSTKFGQGDEAIFKFRCQRSNVDLLGTARDALEEFLSQHDVYPAHAEKRVDTFMDTFSHFNSKLLSTRAQAAEKKNGAEGSAPSASRSGPSTADVKAIFDGTSSSSNDDPSSRGFAGPLSYWQPPSSSSHPPQPHRTDTEHSTSKRDSDPIIQDKMRQATMGPGVPLTGPHGHARGVAARTQSLDITQLNFARALSSGTGGPFNAGPLPASPAAIGSSPKAITQYFPAPAVTTPSAVQTHSQKSSGSGSKGYGFDPNLDSVTNALGNAHI